MRARRPASTSSSRRCRSSRSPAARSTTRSTTEWARHDYRLVLGPFAKRVRLSARPGPPPTTSHYFQADANSAFAHGRAPRRSSTASAGEIAIVLGARASALTRRVHLLRLRCGESAQAYGGASTGPGPATAAGAGYRQVHGDADGGPLPAGARLRERAASARCTSRGRSVPGLREPDQRRGETRPPGRWRSGYAPSKALELSGVGRVRGDAASASVRSRASSP